MRESTSAESLTSRVRSFNRFYTRLIGVLDRGYLKTPYSLQEARVVYEIGASPGSTAKDIRGRTGFDQGDLGWSLHRQSVVYKTEFRYKDSFETYLCEGLAPYMRNYDPTRDRLWVGEASGRPVGCIAIHHVAERPRWAKLRWFLVEREARGKGLGTRLLSTAIAFSRRARYNGIFLWTVSDLDAARDLYEQGGFRLVEEKKGCVWAPWAREQRWELRFGA